MPIKIHFIQIILLASVLPFLLGINECPTNETFQEAVEQKIIASNSKGGSINIHLSFLPVVDKTLERNSEKIISLINELITLWFKDLVKTFNESDVRFTFYDSDNRALSVHMPLMVMNYPSVNTTINAKKMVDIIYHSSIYQKNKIRTVILNYMVPLGVDILITGQYTTSTDNKGKLELVALFKSNQKFILKQLSFQIDNFLCEDKKSHNIIICNENVKSEITNTLSSFFINEKKPKKTLKAGMGSYVTYKLNNIVLHNNENNDVIVVTDSMLKSLQELANTKVPSTTFGGYITQLSFMNTDTKSIMVQTQEAKLINDAVLDGIKRAQKVNSAIKFNASGHVLKNTDANVGKLTKIIYDRNKTPEERKNIIINDMMVPNKLDVIVTGQYLDRGTPYSIILKPFILVKKNKKIVTKSLKFDRQQFICSDPNDSTQKALCASSHEEIANAVQDLLESL